MRVVRGKPSGDHSWMRNNCSLEPGLISLFKAVAISAWPPRLVAGKHFRFTQTSGLRLQLALGFIVGTGEWTSACVPGSFLAV